MKRYGDFFTKIVDMENLQEAYCKASKGKTCVEIQFKLDDKIGVTFTNSSVLERQLDTFKDMMPFEASIKKIHNYYTFT